MKWTQVIEKNFDIVGTSGEEVQCICPWHDDTSGHLYINAAKGLYLCMVCGQKGNLGGSNKKARDLLIDLPNASTQDIRDRLRAHTKARRQRRDVFYPEGWLKQYAVPHDYWAGRGLSDEVVARFNLGYDPFSDRVTLPLRDMHGRILGTTFRRLDDGKPKYLHPKGFPIGKHLYGAHLLTDQRTVAITEGQVDAIRGWDERVPALATMGARITADQVKVLQMMGVRKAVFLYDNDSAGRKGTIASYFMLRGSGIQFRAGWYRPYWESIKDPDGLSGARYRKMFHSALPVLEWMQRSGIDPNALE